MEDGERGGNDAMELRKMARWVALYGAILAYEYSGPLASMKLRLLVGWMDAGIMNEFRPI